MAIYVPDVRTYASENLNFVDDIVLMEKILEVNRFSDALYT